MKSQVQKHPLKSEKGKQTRALLGRGWQSGFWAIVMVTHFCLQSGKLSPGKKKKDDKGLCQVK